MAAGSAKKRLSKKRPKKKPPDPNQVGVGSHQGGAGRARGGGSQHPRPHPRPHPGHRRHDHSHHRAPPWVKVGKHWHHHPGWIGDAVIGVAAATRQAGFDGLDIVSECSAIVADAFASETLIAEEDGPELDPAVAVAYIGEGAICAVLIFIIGICAILLGISLILTAFTIGVGPFNARIGAIFDPFVHLMHKVIRTIGNAIEATISAPAVLVLWFFAKCAAAIGLFRTSTFRHFWHTRFVPLYSQVQWMRQQIRGINHVLFNGTRSVLHRLTVVERRLSDLWTIIDSFENIGGHPSSAALRALEARLAAQEAQIRHINHTLPHLAAHLRHLDRTVQAQHHNITVEAHAIRQLQTHVSAIEYTLHHLSHGSFRGIEQEIARIQHELAGLGHFPITHIENQIAGLQRGINWLDSLHPGRIPGEVAALQRGLQWLESLHPGQVRHEIVALERGLNWLESLHPGRVQHELEVLTHRIDSMPRVNVHEIQTEIEQLQQQVTELENMPHGGHGLTPQQAAQLHTSYHISMKLSPLLLLLPFTAEFMSNLQKLKTCEPMCVNAELPLPDLIDVLVADLVLKEGI
jgi:hypothetical protein